MQGGHKNWSSDNSYTKWDSLLGLCSQTPLGELATLPKRMKKTYEIWAYKSALMVSWTEWMTNGCVLDNISRPHRQRSNAARKLKCFWRRCGINTNRIGIQKRWHGLLVAQKVNKRYLTHWLWSPYVIGRPYIFSSCDFYLSIFLSSFFFFLA